MLCLLSCGSLHSAPHLGCVPERILIILIIIIIIIIIIVIVIFHYYSQKWQFYYFCFPLDFEKLKERDHVLLVFVNQCLADVVYILHVKYSLRK